MWYPQSFFLKRVIRTETNFIFPLPWYPPSKTSMLKISSTFRNIPPEWILIISNKSHQNKSTFFIPYLLESTEISSCWNITYNASTFETFMLRGACRVSQVVRKLQTYYSVLPNTYVGFKTYCDLIIKKHIGGFLQRVSLLNCYLKEFIWVDLLNCLGNCSTLFVFFFFITIGSTAHHVFNWLTKSAQTRLWMTNWHLDIRLLLYFLWRTCIKYLDSLLIF